jgi:3-dehydroquinate synthase
METIQIQGETASSRILIGESLRNLVDYVPQNRCVIITDANVRNYYQRQFPPFPVIEIGMGEKIKTLDTVQSIYEQLMDYELDRSSFLVGIGGGIVCDITGYVASTYLRGIGFGYVATSLLAQVDASVGGKTGVNYRGFKNMIGTFNQPQFVICDLGLLQTLPEDERWCGFAEIIKHAAIADPDLFAFLESNVDKALELDREAIEKLVSDSIKIKARIVNEDEKEKGERRKLNFGHTFGHALQKVAGVNHGAGVSAGMVIASEFSVKTGLFDKPSHERLRSLIAKYKLPLEVSAKNEDLLEAIRMDKKRQDLNIQFVFLKAIGQAVVQKMGLDELNKLMRKEL